MTTASWFSATAPVTREVHAYFAPVDRTTNTPTSFDFAQEAAFDFDAPPSPWIKLGPVRNFVRKSTSKNAAVSVGTPAVPLTQLREIVGAEVSFDFLSWTKLTMALATGSQHMNVLSGTAVAVQNGSTTTFIALASADTASFTAGQIVAIDADCNGQTGFIGSPVSGAYMRQALSNPDVIRRVTFNVALIARADSSGLTLATPLPGGVPATGMKVQAISGFIDREGGSFVQEWSALFVIEGTLGERILFYYPRLQPSAGAEEASLPLTQKGKLERIALRAKFIALPITDATDGERVVCYRAFVPAKNARV